MKTPFKGTDTTVINLSDVSHALMLSLFEPEHTTFSGEVIEQVAAVMAKLEGAPGPHTLSHDELALMHALCKKTMFAKNKIKDAAVLMKTVREGFEFFYK